jgi:hypothetical protein
LPIRNAVDAGIAVVDAINHMMAIGHQFYTKVSR